MKNKKIKNHLMDEDHKDDLGNRQRGRRRRVNIQQSVQITYRLSNYFNLSLFHIMSSSYTHRLNIRLIFFNRLASRLVSRMGRISRLYIIFSYSIGIILQ